MIKVIYNKVCGRCVQSEPLTSGMVGQPIHFEYSHDFDGLAVTAVFTDGKNTVDVVNPGNECIIPHEVLTTVGAIVKVGVYAVKGDKLVIPTIYAHIGVVLKGADPSGDASADPTLPVWAQIEAIIGNLNDLTTEAKNNLVAAINEAAQTGSGGGSTVELDTTLTQSGKAADAKAVGDALAVLENKIPTASGGMSVTAADLLVTILRNGVYGTDQSNNISALATELGVTEEEEPDTPAVTLSSISAIYTGGDVAVGTAVTDLTGIVVTAHYSDGTSATVTGYTMSGTIAEGENTITVIYQGKSATFTVNGIAESTGENNGWLNGVPYADMGWIDGYIVKSGNVTEDSGMSASDFLPCRGASGITLENWYSSAGISFYDENNEFVMVTGAFFTEPVPVPLNAYYARFNKRTSTTNTVATPKLFDKLTEHTVYELGKYYSLDWESGKSLDKNTGAEKTSSNPIENVSAYAFCMGATTVTFAEKVRSLVCFYDSNKTFISSNILSTTINTVNIPGSAAYFRYDTWDYNDGHNVWVKLA